jgi:hypothetical protein
MAEFFLIDQIFDHPAYPGLLVNAFIDAGIPAFAPEIGAPRIFDHHMIPVFVEGTMTVFKHHGIIPGPIGRPGGTRVSSSPMTEPGPLFAVGGSGRGRIARTAWLEPLWLGDHYVPLCADRGLHERARSNTM